MKLISVIHCKKKKKKPREKYLSFNLYIVLFDIKAFNYLCLMNSILPVC